MPIYRREDDGRYVGTQAEAGKGFTTIELPNGKGETLALLNEARNVGYVVRAAEAAAAPVADPTVKCALCRREVGKAEIAAKKLADGVTADALAERMLDAETWFVARLFAALAERVGKK